MGPINSSSTSAIASGQGRGSMPKPAVRLSVDSREFAGRRALVRNSAAEIRSTTAAGPPRRAPSAMIALAKPCHVVAPAFTQW